MKSPVIHIIFAGATLAFAVGAVAVDLTEREAEVLSQICAECHARPETTAPLMGDVTAWQARNVQGLEVLVRNTVLGRGNMPPLGTCGYCSEAELRHLVQMLSGLPESGRAR